MPPIQTWRRICNSLSRSKPCWHSTTLYDNRQPCNSYSITCMRALYSPTSSPCLLHRDRASIQTAFRLVIPGAAQPDSCFLLHLERSGAYFGRNHKGMVGPVPLGVCPPRYALPLARPNCSCYAHVPITHSYWCASKIHVSFARAIDSAAEAGEKTQ